METTAKTVSNPNVLITGASGFLGKYAVEEFSKHGYSVIANGRNIDALNALESDAVQILHASLSELTLATVEVDSVVHAAALSSPWGRWKDFYEHNVTGTEQVVKYCVNNEVRRLVYVSTPSVYTGRGDRYSISETDYDENNHLNNYIKSKIAAEKIVQAAQAEGVIPEVVVIRPRGLLGVGDPSMIPRLLKANDKIGIPLFDDGENLVDFTCVENAALSLRLAVESPQAVGNVYNITNGEPRTFKSVLDDFFAAINEKPRYKRVRRPVMYAAAMAIEAAYSAVPGKPEPLLTRYVVCTLGYSQTLDISRAQQDLRYKPTLTLDEGIRNYAADYRSRRA